MTEHLKQLAMKLKSTYTYIEQYDIYIATNLIKLNKEGKLILR